MNLITDKQNIPTDAATAAFTVYRAFFYFGRQGQ